MELIQINNNLNSQLISEDEVIVSKGNFLEANTQQVTLNHIKRECVLPHYNDNMPSISHAEFIDATNEVVHDVFSGNQIGSAVKSYYQDANFNRNEDGSINLWQLYNNLTEANKSSYIDSNLERNANAWEFVTGLANSM